MTGKLVYILSGLLLSPFLFANPQKGEDFVIPKIDLAKAPASQRQPIGVLEYQTPEQLLSQDALAATSRKDPGFEKANVTFFQKIKLLIYGNNQPTIREVGFITDYFVRAPTDRVARVITIQDKYALNFDDGELVYFSLPHRAIGSQPPPTRSRPLFSKDGKVLLPKATKHYIIDYSINKTGIQEANHISIVDNRIILDTKPSRINHIQKTMDAIQLRPKVQKTESLMNVLWQPRKNPKNPGQ